MPAPEGANIYGVQIRESANDGSDFSNAASDYRILFLGEDGLLHVKDSSGTVTSPYTGGGGGLVLLEQHSPSAAAQSDFTTWYSSTYDDYWFEILNLVPATANVDLFVRFGVSGSYDSTSNYSNTTFSQSVGDGNVSTGAAGTTAMKLRNASVIDSNTSGGVTGSLRLWYPGNTSTFRRALLDCSYLDGDPEQAKTWCEYTGNGGSAIDSVRFFFSSGNITSGTIRCYGIVKT